MTADITTTDLPEGMAASVRYERKAVVDLVEGDTIRQFRRDFATGGKAERHYSVVASGATTSAGPIPAVRRLGDRVQVDTLWQGHRGVLSIRDDQVVEVIAN